ncbi:MAG: HlyD family efflux transporter periplasmic adaptor subunit, partial [Oscillospiraceae bacterium]|nr:HlyD family efflux transporter periplasmic adaptor subunit [Oscillospiraceae bacterium]
ELIKTIAIVFLAVLLVLTFFSGTIMNYSLPEVATQLVSSGTINAKIRGSGTLAANESYEVMLDQTREIHSVGVKVGDKVEEGDLLFVLSDVESAELAAAQEALEKARISYQEQMLNFSKEYATDNQAVKALREDLEKARKEVDENYVTDEEVSYAKGDLAAAKTNLSQIELTLKELNALAGENEEYSKAKENETALENRIKTLESEIDGFQADLEKLDTGADVSTQRKIQDAQAALERAQYTWKSDWMAYKSSMQSLYNAVQGVGPLDISSDNPHTISLTEQMYIESYFTQNGVSAIKPGVDGGGTGSEGEQSAAPVVAESTLDNQKKWKEAYDALLADQLDVEAKSQALQRLQQDSSISSGNTYEQRRTIQNKIDNANAELSAAQRDLRIVQQDLDRLSNSNTQVKDQIRAYEASQRQQEANIATLESNLTDLQAKQTAYKAAKVTMDSKQRELETMLTGDDIDKKLNNLTLQSLSLEIEKQEELVEKYQKDSVGAEVHSPVSGVISSISVSAGKKTDPSTALAVIDVVDRGYIIKIPVTNEQAKQVKVGDAAEVTNYYWGSDISATLESIAPDPNSGGQKKLLVFRVSGDIDAGTNISLSVGQRSANFDALVPKSAIREDANGKFVLVVTAKSTPLGNRYTATRADVQVLAEDDTSAAVSGLSANDYVITTSSKPIDPGSQVRMVENP